MGAEQKIEAASFPAALVAALAEIGGAAKDKINPAFKSKYADLGSVIDAIKPILAGHGLAFTQHTTPSEDGVMVETFVRHTSGEKESLGSLYVPANKRDAQGFGSALTYARRYALMTAFGVPAEDDDGNAAAKAPHEAKVVPFAQEAPPKPRQVLAGPHTSPSTLKGAVKAIVHALEGFADVDEFEAYMATDEVKATVTQCERDMPDWYFGGPSVPDEFIPLQIRIDRKRRELEEVETLRVRNPIAAG
jgi:hypothetical protein